MSKDEKKKVGPPILDENGNPIMTAEKGGSKIPPPPVEDKMPDGSNIPRTKEERAAFKKKAEEGYQELKKRLIREYVIAERMDASDAAFYLFSGVVVMLELEAMFFNRTENKSVSSTEVLKSRLRTELPREVLPMKLNEENIDSLALTLATWSVELSQWTQNYGHPTMRGFVTSLMSCVNEARVASLYQLYSPSLKEEA